MKLQKHQSGTTVVNNTRAAVKVMGLRESRMAILLDMLSKGIYSDPIGSPIREYASNAWDAHTAAGHNDPIIITLDTDNSGDFISIQDFGKGMSPEFAEQHFFEYLGTDKEDSDDFIGAFGLGSKSGLAYSDSFYMTTIHEGMEYNYMMFKDGNKASHTLLSKVKSDERSGTTVKIYIKSFDVSRFRNACILRLMFIENVSLTGKHFEGITLPKLYKGQYFTAFTNPPTNQICVNYGGVYYPLKHEEIELNNYNLAIALNFSIGELEVQTSREELSYTQEGIKLIKERLEQAITELSEMYNKTSERASFAEFVEGNKEKGILNINNEITLNITPIANELKIRINEITVKNCDLIMTGFDPLWALKSTIEQHSAILQTKFRRLTDSYKGKYVPIKVNYIHQFKNLLSNIVWGEPYEDTERLKNMYLLDEVFSVYEDDCLVVARMTPNSQDLPYINYTSSDTQKLINNNRDKFKPRPDLSYQETLNYNQWLNAKISQYLTNVCRQWFKDLENSMETKPPVYSEVVVPDDFVAQLKARRVSVGRDYTTYNVKVLGDYYERYTTKTYKTTMSQVRIPKDAVLKDEFKCDFVVVGTDRETYQDLVSIIQNFYARYKLKFKVLIMTDRHCERALQQDNAYDIRSFVKKFLEPDFQKKARERKVLTALQELDYDVRKYIDKYHPTLANKRAKFLEKNSFAFKDSLYTFAERVLTPLPLNPKLVEHIESINETFKKFDFLQFFNLDVEGVDKVIQDYMTCKNIQL